MVKNGRDRYRAEELSLACVVVAGFWGVAGASDLRTWLVEQCSEYTFDVGGVFQRDSDLAMWPLSADGPAELEQR